MNEIRVGEKSEGDYLSAKTAEQQSAWATDKATVDAQFRATLATDAAEGGIQTTAGTAPFVLHPTIFAIEPGYEIGISNSPCVIKMSVQVTSADGRVLDEIEIVDAKGIGYTTHDRMSRAGIWLGKSVARYLKSRVNREGSSSVQLASNPKASSSEPPSESKSESKSESRLESPPEEPPTQNRTSGLAAAVGIGYQTPLFGVEVAYYIKVADGWFLTPYVGIGGFYNAEGPGDFLFGYSGGLMAIYRPHYWGVFLDAGYGLAAAGYGGTTDAVSGEVSYGGVTFAIGGEYMANSGFLVRASAGVTDILSCDLCGTDQVISTVFSPTGNSSGNITPTSMLAIGWKFL
jgi:hypothetical protein